MTPAVMILFEITFQSSLCGYQIRMENQSGEWTRLLYCTTGVLLRKLQHDKHLSSLTHIIVDEVQTLPLCVCVCPALPQVNV